MELDTVEEQAYSHAAERTMRLRAATEVVAAGQAAQLLLVADLVQQCELEVPSALTPGRRLSSDPDLASSVAADETMVALGVGRGPAVQLVDLATRLVRVLPQTFAALLAGRLDLPRAQAMVDGTAELSDRNAQAVQAAVLPSAGEGPWDGPSPRAWKARIERAVVRVDADAARRRQLSAIAARCVRTWPNPADGTATLMMTAASRDIAMVDRVVADLASAWPATSQDGSRLTMDQRRCDAVLDVFRRIRDGEQMPCGAASRSTAREPDVGLVLHADTLFADGPAAAAPGQVRHLGQPAALDSTTAIEQARTSIARGAATRVLLVGPGSTLQRVVRLRGRPGSGWTRAALTAAVRAAMPGLRPLQTLRYAPSAAIAEHVRLARPTCSFYDCARASPGCDLDHDTPWPRGPTEVGNIDPKCQRHHDRKTLRLLHSRLQPGGEVTWTTFTGLVLTTRPDPLPGYAPGEGYDQTVAT